MEYATYDIVAKLDTENAVAVTVCQRRLISSTDLDGNFSLRPASNEKALNEISLEKVKVSI